jgi:hypothetical protein
MDVAAAAGRYSTIREPSAVGAGCLGAEKPELQLDSVGQVRFETSLDYAERPIEGAAVKACCSRLRGDAPIQVLLR